MHFFEKIGLGIIGRILNVGRTSSFFDLPNELPLVCGEYIEVGFWYLDIFCSNESKILCISFEP